MARVSLRECSAEDLSQFAFKAMSTWGNVNDYRHFLPRILELAFDAAGSDFVGFDLDVIAGKLEYGQWLGWPAPEREAIWAYIDDAWRVLLQRGPDWSPNAAAVLPGCVAIHREASRCLAIWATEKSTASALQLAELVKQVWPEIHRTGGLSLQGHAQAFSDDVATWVRDPVRKATIECAFEILIDTPHALLLAEALDGLEWIGVAAAPDVWRNGAGSGIP